MKFNGGNLRSLWCVAGACLVSGTMLAACAKAPPAVSIHGVNYSAETFSYLVTDPINASNTAGGELIDPYAAGGTSCCYDLPKKWQPGTKISIQSTHWLGKVADNSLHEVVGTHLVDVPCYIDGKPGEMWVLRAADGIMSVVLSDFQPDHPQWPGKQKGWPIPSLAYQRERWDLYIDHEKGGVRLFESLLKELERIPDVRAEEDSNFALREDKKSIEGFSGPSDPKYRAKLRLEFEEGLKRSREQLARLEKGRP